MDSETLRIHNPDGMPVCDPVEESGRDLLWRKNISHESNAGRIFLFLWHELGGRPGTIETTRHVVLLRSGASSESGSRYGLAELYAAHLVAKRDTGKRQGPLVLEVLLASPADPQGYIPELEPKPRSGGVRIVRGEETTETTEDTEQAESGVGSRESEDADCRSPAAESGQTGGDKTAQSNCAVEPRSCADELRSSSAELTIDDLQKLLEAKRAEAAKAVAATKALPPAELMTADSDATAQEVRRSKSKSLSETKDLDLDLAETQRRLEDAKLKALKKSGSRAIRIEQLQLLVPGLYRQIARRIIDDIDSGLYTEKVVNDCIDRGLDLVKDGDAEELWHYVEGSMRECAAERHRPWPPKSHRRRQNPRAP